MKASLLRRLACIVYDGLLLLGMLFTATLLVLGFTAITQGTEAFLRAAPLGESHFFRAYLLLVCTLFYGGFWTHGGQTLGMRAWRLRLQRTDGQAVRWPQALLRFSTSALWIVPFILASRFGASAQLSMALSMLCFLLLLLTRLPDRLSETALLVLPKPSISQ